MTHRDPNAPARKQPKFQSITLKWDRYSDISAEAERLGVTRARVTPSRSASAEISEYLSHFSVMDWNFGCLRAGAFGSRWVIVQPPSSG